MRAIHDKEYFEKSVDALRQEYIEIEIVSGHASGAEYSCTEWYNESLQVVSGRRL